MHGSAQHTVLVPVTRSVRAGLQILILYLSTGLWKQNRMTEEEISDKPHYGPE